MKIPPDVGDHLYFMTREVVVDKVYKEFHFVEYHHIDKPEETRFCDWGALTKEPDTTPTISIW